MLKADIGKYISDAATMTKEVEGLMLNLLLVVQCTLAAYRQICDGTTIEKTRTLAETHERIEMLKDHLENTSAMQP